MGWFDNPRCPHCGGELQETGYCFPYPAWRCPTCIKRKKKEKERDEEMERLKARVAELEAKEEAVNGS